MAEGDRLAIDVGQPVVADAIPSGVSGPSVVGDEEIEAVTQLLRSQRLFRYREGGEATQFEREAAKFLGG